MLATTSATARLIVNGSFRFDSIQPEHMTPGAQNAHVTLSPDASAGRLCVTVAATDPLLAERELAHQVWHLCQTQPVRAVEWLDTGIEIPAEAFVGALCPVRPRRVSRPRPTRRPAAGKRIDLHEILRPARPEELAALQAEAASQRPASVAFALAAIALPLALPILALSLYQGLT